MYDLLLKGGTVIDPAQNMRGAFDVAVEDGKIAMVAAGIPAAEARRVIHVPGKTVTAGLIDLHTHVFDGVAANGVHPDVAGVHAGVTTVVDAGSSGCATFSAFPRHTRCGRNNPRRRATCRRPRWSSRRSPTSRRRSAPAR